MGLHSLEDVGNAVSALDAGAKPLGDVGIPVAIADYSIETSPEFAVAGETLLLTAGFDAAVEEFNSLDDVDSAGTLGSDPASRPPIVLTTESAWLKYRLGGSLRLAGGGDIGSIGFAFDAQARLDLLDYRRHSRDEHLADAVGRDLSQPRVIFSLESVRKMTEGEALALRANGSLRLGVTFSWADIVTSGLTSLTAALEAASPVSITLNAGLTTSVDVSLEGAFELLYARDETGLRITVRKAASTGLGVSAKVGAGASFTNLDKAVTGVLDSLLGARYQTVVSTLRKADPASLTASERRLFEAIVARLGLAEEVETVKGLLEKIAGFKEEAEAKLVEIAKSRIELGMAYEYSRTKTNEVLIDAYVEDDAAFAAAHPFLIRADVRPLLADVRDHGKFDLRGFLHRSTLDTKGSWGFTLSVGKLLSMKGVDSDSLRTVQEWDGKGRTRMTLEAVRGYAASFAGSGYSWTVNFLATMKEFVESPNASDFDYGLHLAYSPKEKTGPADMEFLSDLGALWGVGSYDPASQDSLAAALADNSGAFTVTLAFPEIALAEIAERAAADTDRTLLASAMAAALPYRRDWPERRALGIRRALYTPILRALITDVRFPSLGPSAVRVWISDELRKRGASNAGIEGKENVPGSVCDVLSLQSYFAGVNSFMDHVMAFERGVRSLAQLLGSHAAGVAPSEITYAYDQMKPFLCQSFFVRTVAHYFFLLAHETGVAGKVQRAATLEYGGGSKVLIQ